MMAQGQGIGQDDAPKPVVTSRVVLNTAASMSVSFGVKTLLKQVVDEERPDHSDCKSFPSGHAALAFAGATSLHKAYGKRCPWVSVAGFGVVPVCRGLSSSRLSGRCPNWTALMAG